VNVIIHNPALVLADQWQREFPLRPDPFAVVAAQSGLSQLEAVDLLQSLCDQGVLARIGATVRPNTAGASTLAAMAVPENRLHEVALLVSEHLGVNHNYEREHDINLWFVVTADNRAQVNWVLYDIAERSGIEVLDLPLQRSYHIDLGFRIAGERTSKNMDESTGSSCLVDDLDRQLLRALEAGLPLVLRPYHELANRIGWNESQVLARLQSLIERRIITRFGCILRHRKLGYQANAMAVWDVPDDKVDDIAKILARRDEVTLCYRRTRRPPAWPYNLFAMIHGQERKVVTGQIAQAAQATGLQQYASATLFSWSCFKQSAARLSPVTRETA